MKNIKGNIDAEAAEEEADTKNKRKLCKILWGGDAFPQKPLLLVPHKLLCSPKKFLMKIFCLLSSTFKDTVTCKMYHSKWF